jgi:hypothetical protein
VQIVVKNVIKEKSEDSAQRAMTAAPTPVFI